MGCEKPPDIDSLLGSVGQKGLSDSLTSRSLTDVISTVTSSGAIPIPAHVDREKGLFCALHGSSLSQVLDCEGIFAMELANLEYEPPQLYIEKNYHGQRCLGPIVIIHLLITQAQNSQAVTLLGSKWECPALRITAGFG